MASRVMGIKIVPGHGRAMDLGMTLGNSPGPDNTMDTVVSAGHSDEHGAGSSMALGHQHGHKLSLRPQASM